MLEPPITDRVRIALGLAILQSKPDDQSLGTYILHLRSAYLTKPLSSSSVPVPVSPSLHTGNLERACLDKIRALEGEVRSLKRKVVQAELDAAYNNDRPKAPPQQSLPLTLPSSVKRHKKDPQRTSRSIIDRTTTKPPKSINADIRASPGQTNTHTIMKRFVRDSPTVPALVFEYGRFRPPPGKLFPYSESEAEMEMELDSESRVENENGVLGQAGDRPLDHPLADGATTRGTSGSTVARGGLERKGFSAPKKLLTALVQPFLTTGQTDAQRSSSEAVMTLDTWNSRARVGAIVEIDRSLDRISDKIDVGIPSINISTGAPDRDAHETGTDYKDESVDGSDLGRDIRISDGVDTSTDLADAEYAEDVRMIGNALERITSRVRGKSGEATFGKHSDPETFGMLSALLLPPRAPTASSLQQAEEKGIELDVLVDCADSVIDKLGSLLAVCVDPTLSSRKAIADPMATIKLVFRLVEHVVGGACVKLTSCGDHDATMRRIAWTKIVLVVKSRICDPAIDSLAKNGPHPPSDRADHRDNVESTSAADNNPTRRSLTGCTDQDARCVMVVCLESLARTTISGVFLSDPALDLAAMIAHSAMRTLVRVVRGVAAPTIPDVGADPEATLKQEAMSGTVHQLCLLISALASSLPADGQRGTSLNDQLVADPLSDGTSGPVPAERLAGPSIRTLLVETLADILSVRSSETQELSEGGTRPDAIIAKMLLTLAEDLMLAEGEEGAVRTWLFNGLISGQRQA